MGGARSALPVREVPWAGVFVRRAQVAYVVIVGLVLAALAHGLTR